LVMAEVRALPTETSAEITGAPSIRRKPSRNPPSSTIEIATDHLFLAASASQAARAFFTSAEVRQCLVRISVPPIELQAIELDLLRFVQDERARDQRSPWGMGASHSSAPNLHGARITRSGDPCQSSVPPLPETRV